MGKLDPVELVYVPSSDTKVGPTCCIGGWIEIVIVSLVGGRYGSRANLLHWWLAQGGRYGSTANLLYWWVAQDCDCVGVVGPVNVVEWLSSDETLLFLPIMVIFGEPVDPLRSVRAHVSLEGHRGDVIQPILSRRDEEDTTVICIVLLLLWC